MTLSEYFARTAGTGVLATADGEGRVDGALYATPRAVGKGQVAFLMRNRQTRANLQANPHAAYIFVEEGPGYRGLRLFLRRTGEDQDPERVAAMTRRRISPAADKAAGPKFVNYFEVEKIVALVGDETLEMTAD